MKKNIGLFAATLWCSTALAEGPRFYNLESFGAFLDGNPESTAVSEDGAITLPPLARERYAETSASFSAATARADEIIVARNDDAQVVAISADGKTRNIFKPSEAVVTALLGTSQGLFVAVGSPAKIYRVDNSGKATTYFVPQADFVWDMVEGPGGALFCVTGNPGTVVKISGAEKGEVLFKPDQEHLKSLYWDKDLGLFVGGGERGVVYRSAKLLKDFRALFDTGHTEVTALVVHNGFVYAAGVTGAQTLSQDPPDKGKKRGKDGANVRSQVTRIAMDGAAETLAGSSDEAVFDMALMNKNLIAVATGATGRDDPRGRLYTIEPKKREISMIYQSPSRRITHLVDLSQKGLAAVAAAGGRVVTFAAEQASSGEFFTVPFDAGINSRFGAVQVFGSWPQGTQVTVAVRSGQTSEPDDSWSAWSKEIAVPGGNGADVSNGRFVQLRLKLKGTKAASPEVYRIRLAYLRQNLAPYVREVVALEKGFALLPMPNDEPKSKTISLGEKGDDNRREGDERRRSPQPRARQVESRGALTLKWVAEDPNGDELRYDLMFRGAGIAQWQTLEEHLEEPFYTLNSGQLPDGHYQFRVRASDSPSNPDGAALTDQRESRAILIDNTAPRVEPIKVENQGQQATLKARVKDNVGPFVQADYALDGREFKPLQPDDGVLDSSDESFTIRLDNLAAGRHTLTIRVIDEAENEGFGETQFSTTR